MASFNPPSQRGAVVATVNSRWRLVPWHHVEQAIEGQDKANNKRRLLRRNSDGGENGGEHQQRRRRNWRGAEGRKRAFEHRS
jgi:hypothetical protein